MYILICCIFALVYSSLYRSLRSGNHNFVSPIKVKDKVNSGGVYKKGSEDILNKKNTIYLVTSIVEDNNSEVENKYGNDNLNNQPGVKKKPVVIPILEFYVDVLSHNHNHVGKILDLKCGLCMQYLHVNIAHIIFPFR